MSSSCIIFFFLSLLFLNLPNISHTQITNKFQAFLHPITKDESSNLYYIPLSIGQQINNGQNLGQLSLNLALDLSGTAPILLTCATAFKSSSIKPIKCEPKTKTITKSTCRKFVTSSLTSHPVNARLVEDIVSILYTYNGVYSMDSEKDSNVTLTCTEDITALKPLQDSVMNGTIGLAKSSLSLLSQFVSLYKLENKLAICLPSKTAMEHVIGDIFIGGGPYYYLPFLKDVSEIFVSTPLITNHLSSDYFIDVKSIEIGEKVVPFDQSILNYGTKITTLAPYTVLHSSIYKGLVTTFVETSKMVKAPAVKPFGVCFMSKVRYGVPVIKLVLNGGDKWRIYGSNSLVKVSKDVVCLGFVDGGLDMKNAMVIGGFQMEDNLVEFDLKASKFSVSSSLLLQNTSCSVPRLRGM